jgi:hypothetical protein
MGQMEGNFTLDHARKLAVIRSYGAYIERRASALMLGDDGSKYQAIRTVLDDAAKALRAIRIREQGVPHKRCPPDYEECEDGSCEVMCS